MMKRKLILLFLIILVVSCIIMPPLNAAAANSTKNFKQTEIKVITYHPHGNLINNNSSRYTTELYVTKNEFIKLAPGIYVNNKLIVTRFGISPIIHFSIYTNDKNKTLVLKKRVESTDTMWGGTLLPKLSVGDYTIVFSYAGGKIRKLLPCEKVIPLHILAPS